LKIKPIEKLGLIRKMYVLYDNGLERSIYDCTVKNYGDRLIM